VCVLGEVAEVAPEEALDEIEGDPIAGDVLMVSVVDALLDIRSTTYVGLWTARISRPNVLARRLTLLWSQC